MTETEPIVYCPECGQHEGSWHLVSCSSRGRVRGHRLVRGKSAP